jgi:sarcosine oxidase
VASALRKAEVIVAGLGAMGSAACCQLAARGVSVIGFDQYEPPHRYGSTHGDTRITRLAMGEGPEYVPLVRRSHELWRELEARTGAQLLTETGGVILSRPNSPFAEQTRAVAQSFAIEHELLSNAELRRRFPMFDVDDETEAYYEPAAGYVRPEAAVATQLDQARRDGAVLRPNERVDSWTATHEGVSVTTGAATYGADQLVLCAGPWLPQLFPQADEILAVHRQLMYWFEIRERYEQLREMPIFVWDFGGEQDEFVHLHGFYGFPAIDGADGGLKLATESYEKTTRPDREQPGATPAEIADMYRTYVEPRLPWLGRRPTKTVACLYTCTRGSRFLIDRHPEHDSVLIVSPCSGHGFKHSPAIGEAVAQWVIGGATAPDVDLSAFRLSRQARGTTRGSTR